MADRVMMPSAHVDTSRATTCRRAAEWPEFVFDSAGAALSGAARTASPAFLDRWIAAGRRRPAVPDLAARRHSPTRSSRERVNRIANVLTRDLGLVPGNRVLLRGPNNPMMVAAYLAVLKAGGVVVATMPLLRAQGDRLPDHQGARSASRCATIASPTRWRRRKTPAPDLERIVYWGDGTRGCARSPDGESPATSSSTPCDTAADDVCLIALHVRHHRRAQGHHAFPSRHAGELRQLWPPRAARRARRPLHRLAAARLHVRARRAGAVSRCGSAPRRSCWRRRRPTNCCRRSRRYARHRLLHGAHRLSRHAAEARPSTTSRRCANASPPARRCRRRPSTPGAKQPAFKIMDGIGATEMLHIFIGSPEDDDPRRAPPASRCRATRRGWSTTTASEVPPGTLGRLAVRGPTGCRYLADEPAAKVRRRAAGTSPATPM